MGRELAAMTNFPKLFSELDQLRNPQPKRSPEWYLEQAATFTNLDCPELAKLFTSRAREVDPKPSPGLSEGCQFALFVLATLAAATLPSAILALLAWLS
jgi:hypothetical protein